MAGLDKMIEALEVAPAILEAPDRLYWNTHSYLLSPTPTNGVSQ